MDNLGKTGPYPYDLDVERASQLTLSVASSATVVVPTYNEAENLARLVPALLALPDTGWRAAEVPIQFYDRTSGKSKISRREIARAMYTVLRISARRLGRQAQA